MDENEVLITSCFLLVAGHPGRGLTWHNG